MPSAAAAPHPDARVLSGIEQVPAGRRSVLNALKRRGQADANQLAEELEVTVSAVRQHLAALAEGGLVVHRPVAVGQGRPRHLYRLTRAADELFPRAYGELSTELLACVADEDPDLVDRVFERRRLRRLDRALGAVDGLDRAGQVRALAELLDGDGYVAEVVPGEGGSFRLVEHNCAIWNVALRYGQACGTELSFISEVLAWAEVRRVQHLVDGSHACAYEILPR